MHPQFIQHRNEKYRKWIKTRPSIVSGLPADDAHHVWNTGKKGKHNDYLCVPLTREEHSEYHRLSHDRFEEKYNVDLTQEIVNLLTEYLEEQRELGPLEQLERE